VDPYFSERLADRPVILSTIAEGYSLREHLPSALEPVRVLLDQAEQKLFWVIDMPNLHPGIDELVWSTNYVIRMQAEPLPKHPKLRGIVVINTSAIYAWLFNGLNSAAYGYITGIRIEPTLEAALAYVDGLMADGG
jgi:hypothetical protein